MNDDDATLITQTLAGDRSAFGGLVRRYQDRLFRSLVHVTGDPVEAEDVLQEAFVQAFVKLDSFQSRSRFYSWLYRIAWNLWVSRNRRQRPKAASELIASGGGPAGDQDGPQRLAQREEEVQLVRQAIARLNDSYRAVLVLRDIDGCDYETISQTLDLPIGTVRSRLHRARLQLRDALQNLLGDPLGEDVDG